MVTTHTETEFYPNDSITEPAPLFIFGGDNNDPSNSATIDNVSWQLSQKNHRIVLVDKRLMKSRK